MNLNRIADPAQGGDARPKAKTAQETIDAQNEEITRLKARVSELEGEKAKASEREVAIAKKMEHGLSREQAIAVLSRQEAHDKSKAEAEKAKAESEKAKAATAKK